MKEQIKCLYNGITHFQQTVFATDCVNRFLQTIPFWIDMRSIFNFFTNTFFAPMNGLAVIYIIKPRLKKNATPLVQEQLKRLYNGPIFSNDTIKMNHRIIGIH